MGRGKRLLSFLAFGVMAFLAIASAWYPLTLPALGLIVSPFVALITILMAGDVIQQKGPDVLNVFAKAPPKSD